uniref:Uncharacterized protein n=1 Tax=Arundo donax TaxID=35708 RepID=A0A0A9BC51_ARUDO
MQLKIIKMHTNTGLIWRSQSGMSNAYIVFQLKRMGNFLLPVTTAR